MPRRLCSGEAVLPPKQIQELLESHPAVVKSEIIDGVAYVVKGRKEDGSKKLALLSGDVEDWELKEYLMVKFTQLGMVGPTVPKIRFIDRLPKSFVPFTFVHVFDALWREVDKGGTDRVSFQEFSTFCRSRNLFSNKGEMHEVFFSTRSVPSTSEILFNSSDLFQFDEFKQDKSKIKFYEFQQMILDAGIVEIGVENVETAYHLPQISYFVDERVADIVVRRWFSVYDHNEDGNLHFGEYVRLVADYHLPFAASKEAFCRLDKSGAGGLDLQRFRDLLEEANILRTGASVDKDDEVGKIWRDIQPLQQYLPQTKVFVADGREGASPPKVGGSLRFVCVSDTHGHHREMTTRLPPGDVLLHAGDFTMTGEMDEVADFVAWLQSLPYGKKIIIAGNHDLSFDRTYSGQHGASNTDAEAVRAAFAKVAGSDPGILYLEDEGCSVQGVRIYGSPWQPEFGYWAFNLPRGQALAEKWGAIPAGIDILMVHGPPLGRGDACLPTLKRVGCADLLSEIQGRIRPAFAVCGHVHEGAGVTFDGTTHFVNASSLNEHYEFVHAPLAFDVALPGGKQNSS